MIVPDDEIDHDLLEFMRKALQGSSPTQIIQKPKTFVLEGAQFVFDNAIDVELSRENIVKAAGKIHAAMQAKAYSTETWSSHDLHPKAKDQSTVDFIFTMDLLNFCFWSESDSGEKFAVDYRGQRWTGYWSLVALLQRALDEGIPITCPHFWVDEQICSDELLEYVFRSSNSVEFSLIAERIACLREAGKILCEVCWTSIRTHQVEGHWTWNASSDQAPCELRYEGAFTNMIGNVDFSATALVVRLTDEFPCFQDKHEFEHRCVNFYKRAQILVADLWACFNGESFGEFDDIDDLTMFADYRVPVTLTTLHCLRFSPKLEAHIKAQKLIPSGSSWECQLRGASIWCVEMIRREILKQHPRTKVNAVLIDFYLYDTAKEMEAQGIEMLPHHRTKSIWY